MCHMPTLHPSTLMSVWDSRVGPHSLCDKSLVDFKIRFSFPRTAVTHSACNGAQAENVIVLAIDLNSTSALALVCLDCHAAGRPTIHVRHLQTAHARESRTLLVQSRRGQVEAHQLHTVIPVIVGCAAVPSENTLHASRDGTTLCHHCCESCFTLIAASTPPCKAQLHTSKMSQKPLCFDPTHMCESFLRMTGNVASSVLHVVNGCERVSAAAPSNCLVARDGVLHRWFFHNPRQTRCPSRRTFPA